MRARTEENLLITVILAAFTVVSMALVWQRHTLHAIGIQ